MVSLRLLTENKIASVSAAAIVTGFVILLSASAIETGPVDNDKDSQIQLVSIKKRKTLMAVGGTILSAGVLAQVYDQYTRFSAPKLSSSSNQYPSSSNMSGFELKNFQDRVSAAAQKMRRSLSNKMPDDVKSPVREESAAELAARASAQLSSFMQNYS